MNRKITVAMVCMAFLFTLSAQAGWAQIKGPVIIGFVGPHVGPIAWLGEFQKKGVNLAADDINASGGILGLKVELVFANDAATPATSVASAKKLIHSDKVCAIIGPINSSCAIAVGPVATEAKVPILSNTLSPKVTEAKSPYVLRSTHDGRLSNAGPRDVQLATQFPPDGGSLDRCRPVGRGARFWCGAAN